MTEVSEPGSEPGETGWDRVKSLFTSRYGEAPAQELQDLSTTVLVASFVGFLFGGFIGARHAGDKYILMNHSTKYASPMQAQRELHGAALLGFARHGCRWGWKVGVFAGIFSGSHTLLSVYRDREDALNYVAAGAVTGGLFRVSAGLKPAIGGTVLGVLLSLPIGVLMHGLDLVLLGREERERVKRERLQNRQNREKEWKKRLESTSELIQDLEKELQPTGSGEGGLEKYYSTEAQDSQTTAETPPAKKKRKSLSSALLQTPLLRGVERSLLTEEDVGWNSEEMRGRELWLVQLPRDLNPKLLDGQEIHLDRTHQISCHDSDREIEQSYAVKSFQRETNPNSTILLPTSKPGRLTAGPEPKGHLRLLQSVDVPPVEFPPPSDTESKIETVQGLKQRWKPIGWMDPLSTSSQPVSQHQSSKHKHKKSKKSKKSRSKALD